MPEIVALTSYRRGTGKTTLSVGVAAALAAQGYRAGLLDAALVWPAAHELLGIDADRLPRPLDPTIGAAHLEAGEAAVEVAVGTGASPGGRQSPGGRLFLARCSAGSLTGVPARQPVGPDVGRLLADRLALDVLVIDTHAGIDPWNLAILAASDTVGIILRLDRQDHQGTAVLVELARQLAIPGLRLIVNEVTARHSPAQVMRRVEQTYRIPAAGVIPHSQELVALGSQDVFLLRYPDHPLTGIFRELASRLGPV
jgi:MinD-like ATPase involved in chromosome partitioning or flagellar assembly